MTIEWGLRIASLGLFILATGHLFRLAGFRWARVEASLPPLALGWDEVSPNRWRGRRRMGRWGAEALAVLALANLGLLAGSQATSAGVHVLLTTLVLGSAGPSLLMCVAPFLPTGALRGRLEREAREESSRTHRSPRYLRTLFVQWAVGAGLALFAIIA